MSIQNIIDKAQQIEFDRRRVVGQSLSRSQRAKTSERATAQPWKFKITPPGSLSWSDSRGFIEVITLADRVDEYEISLNNNPRMNYITEYQGDLNQTMLDGLNISAASTSTLTLNNLPAIGAIISTSSVNITAVSFTTATNITYARAITSFRTDILITNAEFNEKYSNLKIGNEMFAAGYIYYYPFLGSKPKITAITYNFITIKGIGYTKIDISANPSADSPIPTSDGGNNLVVQSTSSVLVSESTVLFKKGDMVQPENSRYPYAITNDILRGSGTSITLNLNRPVVTSEGITLTSTGVLVGNDCTWKVLVAALPTYKLVANRQVQFTGDFELIEKVI